MAKDPDSNASRGEVAGGERGERAVGVEVGPQEDGGDRDARLGKQGPQQRRRQVNRRDGVPRQGQRRPDRVELERVAPDREVTGLTPRGGSVDRKSVV